MKIINDTTLQDIADAIRAKTGKANTMTPLEMPDEIGSIAGGGYVLIGNIAISNTNVSSLGLSFNGAKRITSDTVVTSNNNGAIRIVNSDDSSVIHQFTSGTISDFDIDCTDTPNFYFGESSSGNHTSTFTNLKVYY